ncbi:MAG: hypothetical protein CMO17_03275 [Thaumarchaeota archaeon]|jgi:hypothetical protein|nr:hypothetical protein [Nitrososphaerota archaeon]|tara:strand:- start:160 stop:351 length:192 start_codon:yes stop_codon:yes gene_type:complete
MSDIERRLVKQADEDILNASPEFLKLIQEFDVKNQLSGGTFYDIYSSVLKSKKDKNKITPKTK